MGRVVHDLSHSTEYRSWGQMKARCYNQKHHAYARYGGRGIKVCERWRTSFVNFYKDMGPKPSKQHSLDRINPNGNYSPKNCRWADDFEQSQSRRDSRPGAGVTFDKHSKTWRATFHYRGKRVLHRRFKNYEDAVKARQKYEQMYHKEQQVLV